MRKGLCHVQTEKVSMSLGICRVGLELPLSVNIQCNLSGSNPDGPG